MCSPISLLSSTSVSLLLFLRATYPSRNPMSPRSVFSLSLYVTQLPCHAKWHRSATPPITTHCALVIHRQK
ncbi:uncharacterized protein DS421_3g71280 [Arachis hypogaea]|nr:uncharacterized protein DS421_3g71280 [Arachis hypogaea]